MMCLIVVMSTIRISAWYTHSEAIIQTLLCSEDQEERTEGVEKILAIGGEGDPDVHLRDFFVWIRRIPNINWYASCIRDLIC